LNIERLLHIATNPAYAGWGSLLPGRPQAALARLSGYSAQITALIMRRVLNGILPLIIFLFASTALVVVNPVLTALLIPVLLAYLVPLYRITRGAAAIQVEYIRSNRAARTILRGVIARLTGLSMNADRKREEAKQCIAGPERMAVEDAYCRKRLAEDRVHLLNTVFFVVCAFVLFGYFGVAAGRGEQRWSELLLYIVALRFAVAELRRVTALMVMLSRCMPEFSRYRAFVDGAAAVRRSNEFASGQTALLPATLTLRCADSPILNGEPSLEVARGTIVWVLQPWKPTHVDLETIATRLWALAGIRGLAVDQTLCFAGLDEQDAPGTAVDVDAQDQWAQLGVAEKLREIVGHGEDAERRQAAQRLGPEATLTIAAGRLLQSHEMIVIAAPVLRAMDESFVTSLMDMHRGGYVVLAAQDPRMVLAPEFDQLTDRVAGVVVLRDGKFIACGDIDWLQRHLSPLRTSLRPRAVEESDGSVLEDDGDDEEEF
jgi:hypothetical protein